MKIVIVLLFSIFLFACQPKDYEIQSEKALNRGIETLRNLNEQGEANLLKAKQYFKEASELNLENISALYWKSNLEIKLGQFNEALKTAQSAIENSHLIGHDYEAYLYMHAGISTQQLQLDGEQYFNKAIHIYEDKINSNINDLDAIINKAITLCYMDQKKNAIDYLNSISLNEENQGQIDQAISDIRSFNPKNFIMSLSDS